MVSERTRFPQEIPGKTAPDALTLLGCCHAEVINNPSAMHRPAFSIQMETATLLTIDVISAKALQGQDAGRSGRNSQSPTASFFLREPAILPVAASAL
jgi:hypothetical protein